MGEFIITAVIWAVTKMIFSQMNLIQTPYLGSSPNRGLTVLLWGNNINSQSAIYSRQEGGGGGTGVTIE